MFAGGAQRTAAVMKTSRSTIPSLRSMAVGRLAKPVQPAALNRDDSVAIIDDGAERADARERRLAIRAGGIVLQLGGPFRDCGQHCIAVRNGLVAGKLDCAGDGGSGTDLLAHGIKS